jgi:hypothetical protein
MNCSGCKRDLVSRDDIHRHNLSCASTGERSYLGRVIFPKPRRVLMDYQEITPGSFLGMPCPRLRRIRSLDGCADERPSDERRILT